MFYVSKVMISLKPAYKVKPHKLRLTPHLPGRDGAPSPWQCGCDSAGCGVWGSATALKTPDLLPVLRGGAVSVTGPLRIASGQKSTKCAQAYFNCKPP